MTIPNKFPKKCSSGSKPPLRTVTEIAETLNVTKEKLSWALKDVDAPKAIFRTKGYGKVWYEPKTVICWYRLRGVK